MKITGKTGLLALFGSPVSHSASPAMYNYCFEKLGLDYVYLAMDIPKEKVEEAVNSARLLQLKGFNLTMPCKIEVMRFLDEISKEASLIGAVNTVVNENGKLVGYNTDGVGFVNNLLSQGIEVQNKVVSMAGIGGAGKAILVELIAREVEEVGLFVRKSSILKATEFVEKIQKVYNAKIQVFDIDNNVSVKTNILKSDVFINATNVGMKPKEDESIIKEDSIFHKNLVVADIVYNPIQTRLLQVAESKGCRTVDGRGMLLYQGVEAFRLFTSQSMPVEEVKERFFS